jgi:predicted DNA-binding helix-hairpin-helix protein
MRFYGFSPEELTDATDRNLPLEKDPKLAWALRHREFFPVDVNKAGRAALLRVPGIGVRNVKRIRQIRRYRGLTLADLSKLRVSVKKAQYFVVTSDHNPAAKVIDSLRLPESVAPPSRQLDLFETADSARTGEL